MVRIMAYTLCVVVLLSGCATGSFNPESFDASILRERAVTHHAGKTRVSAAVPGREETEAWFGLDLYARGVQPVWLEIENQSEHRFRFAPTGVDRDYFSPLEVAYVHRRGMSRQARQDMDIHFYTMAMDRQIHSGETASGFVFTHLSPGTKSFNIDLFSPVEDHSLAFFVDVPGFTPDHAEVEFASLYEPSERVTLDLGGVRVLLATLPCCTTSEDGKQPGLPVNIALIGTGEELLRALLRANWRETSSRALPDKNESVQYLFGRRADAVFRLQRDKKRNRNVMSLWLSPYLYNGEPIWFAQVTHFIGQDTQLQELIFGARVDPDVDESRKFVLQNLWYGQSLSQVGWTHTPHEITYEEEENAEPENKRGYFTNGIRIAIWVSGEPVSMTDAITLEWDDAP